VQLFGRPPAPVGAIAENRGSPKAVSDQLALQNITSSSSATLVAPTVKTSSTTTQGYNLPLTLANLTTPAKTELLLLITLLLVFGFDAAFLWRRGIRREGSHSLVHSAVFAILLASVLVSYNGKLI